MENNTAAIYHLPLNHSVKAAENNNKCLSLNKANFITEKTNNTI